VRDLAVKANTMNNYCGFIEVWSTGEETSQHTKPKDIQKIDVILRRSKLMGLITIAIFKIKLK